MKPVVVGIREFRARLAEFLLDGERPVAVTRHGMTIGYFIPARGAVEDLERSALKQAAARMDAMLKRTKFSTDEVDGAVEDFARRRRRKPS